MMVKSILGLDSGSFLIRSVSVTLGLKAVQEILNVTNNNSTLFFQENILYKKSQKFKNILRIMLRLRFLLRYNFVQHINMFYTKI